MDSKDGPKEYQVISGGINRRKTDGVPHKCIIERFRNQEWAKRISAMLLEIEDSPALMRSTEAIVIAYAKQAREEIAARKPKLKVVSLEFGVERKNQSQSRKRE
jgi:hypothetical protein